MAPGAPCTGPGALGAGVSSHLAQLQPQAAQAPSPVLQAPFLLSLRERHVSGQVQGHPLEDRENQSNFDKERDEAAREAL